MADERHALSTRQREVLDFIRETVADRQYPPSVREIGDALGLSSPSTVHAHLSALVKYGYLRRDPSKPRAIEVVDDSPSVTTLPERDAVRDVPLVGQIAAGTPILAEEQVEDVFPLPQALVGNGPVFMLRVKGDSMIDAGILDGDYVVVRSQSDARDGELVAALVDGDEATVKRLERRPGAVVLHPANPSYEPMTFTDGVQVLGVVVSVLRSL
jgi:repressor LexA